MNCPKLDSINAVEKVMIEEVQSMEATAVVISTNNVKTDCGTFTEATVVVNFTFC